ncbi:MAG: hypothetical protein AB1650_03970 [Candidatus Omnitrophota bacterium]
MKKQLLLAVLCLLTAGCCTSGLREDHPVRKVEDKAAEAGKKVIECADESIEKTQDALFYAM